MKRHLLLLAATSLAFSLSSCTNPSGRPSVNLVSTAQVVKSTPGVIGPLYTVNGVALGHYDPSLYSPYLYDHRGLSHNEYARVQAIRHSREGSVQVGPIVAADAE
ncbi:hypothetical protein [Prosthecobacter sp.]|uniref:hypothetical protein n=1 Tax=Prosthecobacter sp. TaxID=1965333 RepID=UPI002ABAB659|nr:hypothetical protein [Prosthecobacter sp.]MDZ4403986.1 hypothetical protein [Prosthecobacter sp.]